MIDYKALSAVSCLITIVLYFLYLRSGKYRELLSSLSLIAVFLAYFGGAYAMALFFSWDFFTFSAWLRPPFSSMIISLGLLFVEMIWGERIYAFLRKLISRGV